MNRRASTLITFVAALAPMLAVWIEKVILLPRPVGADYADPEVYFFYDSLRIFLGSAPHNVDHPGTPVQLLGALMLRVTGATPLAIDSWRPAMYTIALLLNAAAVMILLRFPLRDVPRIAAVAAIWTFWICPAAMRHIAIWSPEIVYFFAAALALAAFHAYFLRPGSARAAWLGAAIGLCIAVKFVFLSWAIAAAIGLITFGARRVRHTGLMLTAAVAGFFIATLPAITRYGAMFRWITALVSRSDWYGRAKPAPANIAADLVTALTHAKSWHAWMAVALLLLVAVVKRGDAAMRAALLFGTIAIAVNYVMAAKGIVPKEADAFGDIRYRYVLPAAAAAMFLIAEACRAPQLQRRWIHLVLLLVSGVLVCKSALAEINTHQAIVAQSAAQTAAVEDAVRRVAHQNDVIIYEGVALPEYALRAHTYGERRFLRMVERRWPRVGHLYDFETFLPEGAMHWDLFVIRPQLAARSPARNGVIVGRTSTHVLIRPAGGQPH
jgi:hypothetical protein